MPIIKQAGKKLRHDRKRALQTAGVRRTLRQLIKKTRTSPTAKNLSAVFGALDKAAKHHVIHKNRAARLKSRLTRLLKKK